MRTASAHGQDPESQVTRSGGEKDAFTALVRHFGDRLYSIAFRILRDTGRAEDAVQQAFLSAWRDVRFLRDLRAAWTAGGEWERAKLVASVYDRIVAKDREVVEVELTDDAKRHGLAWALP